MRYNGGQDGDYHLVAPNAYSNAGFGAIGADVDAVRAATACTMTGNCAGGGSCRRRRSHHPTGDVGSAGNWTDQGIGSTGQTGSAGYANGTFTVRGAGADIWGSSDGFRFVHQTLTGDGQIVARVTSLQNTHTYAKAGVMIRASLAANAAHAMLDLGPSGHVEWMTRPSAGAETSYLGGVNQPAPVWLRMSRAGFDADR